MCRNGEIRSFINKAIVDIRLRLRCAIHGPSPFAADSPTLAIKRLPLSCARRCTDESNSQFIGALGLSSTCFPKTAPSLNTLLGYVPKLI